MTINKLNEIKDKRWRCLKLVKRAKKRLGELNYQYITQGYDMTPYERKLYRERINRMRLRVEKLETWLKKHEKRVNKAIQFVWYFGVKQS